MNKDKISAQDIIDSLASSNDEVTKRLSEDFFKALITSIEEALLQNDSVKIKGLGTFKLKWVAPRKSVNVQTGEDILLSGYYKVDFTPDNELKTLVNKPFEHLEAVVLDGNKPPKKVTVQEDNTLNSLTEQAEEIKDLLSEIQSMQEESTAEIIIEEEIITEEEIIVTETQIEIEAPVIEVPQPEKISEQPKETAESININELLPPPAKKKKTWLWILLSALLVLIVVFFVLFFYNWHVNQWVNTYILKRNTPKVESTIMKEEPAKVIEPVVVVVEEPEVDSWQDIFDNRLQNQEYIETIKVPRGAHLAQLAEQYYGSPYFWVYIYEANRSVLKNPNMMSPGMTIKIPKIDNRLIDLNDSRNVEKALELKDLYSK